MDGDHSNVIQTDGGAASGTIFKEKDFYVNAQKYWSEIPATVNGMLGGLGYINDIDIQGSNKFIRELKINNIHKKCALDCGAGIGRVTKNLLLPLFGRVDLVEQDQSFAEKARDYCTQDSVTELGYSQRLGEIYNIGLQKFQPKAKEYDVVWSQWVLGHLTDDDLLNFLVRIKRSLKPKGFFIMKENVTSSKRDEDDDTDSSVTRPLRSYERFIKQSGYKIEKITHQQNFPKGLYPVYMIACRPLEYSKP